ncbi:MAG: beta-lactamase family protein [Candidatus Eisenbacteria bacterium]|uniref:Beta-lactamase family protein n=1 Tax=Eiseniibacteriota bacterium TaxID=2212470 RepID=A0A849SMZ0_UNCEI|nr:beta-lactamase family protein [Candidatus Eisenbacteria bacterium]
MRSPSLWTACALAVAIAGCGSSSRVSGPAPEQTLASRVESIRLSHRLPALAVAVIAGDSIEIAVGGVRKIGAIAASQRPDLFHVGSLTKALVASAIGKLVEEGALSWSETLEQAFPELAGTMTAAYRPITIAQLLQHRSGLPAFSDFADFAAVPTFAGDGPAQRAEFARWLLARPAAFPAGTFVYSNAGYSVAATIAERATAQPWEELLRTRILTPLGVSTFVGWPLDFSAAEPWGHIEQNGTLVPIAPSDLRVPLLIAPAGDLSFTADAYAKLARWNLRALMGSPAVLADSTFQHLYSPVGDYALGWGVVQVQGRTIYTHTGSAGTFVSLVWLDPERGRGYVIMTNASGSQVDPAFRELLAAIDAPTSTQAIRNALERLRPQRGELSVANLQSAP